MTITLRLLLLALAIVVAALTAVSDALSAWPSNTAVNLGVSIAANNQNIPAMLTDGAGGAIVIWTDMRGGGRDIYAGHVLPTGANDPAWPEDGQSLCLAAGDQTNATLVEDMSGGVLVVWQDNRNGNLDVFAKRIGSNGLTSLGWPTDGLAVCTAADSQSAPVAVSDGQGGAFIAWQDRRTGTTPDIYAHHVLSSGELDPAWPAQGLAVCTAAGRQERARIVSDGGTGFIVAWSDRREGIGADDIYASRLIASGSLAPGWPANGLAVCAETGPQQFPAIASDGSGGAILVWSDERSGAGSTDVYAQRLLGSGSVHPGWAAGGVPICVAVGAQSSPVLLADGSHGALIAWIDLRSGVTTDVYAQRVLSTGFVDPEWPANGRALCLASNNQATVVLAPDGYGGAIASWTDFRASSVNPDIYATRVFANGAVDSQWPADGAAVSLATGSQASPKILADGSGGAVLLWTDNRNGSTNADLYAQRVQANGELGGDVVGVSVNDLSLLRLGPLQPNPIRRSGGSIAFRHGPAGSALLELFDVHGRRLSNWALSSSEATRGALELRELGELKPGVYHLRLTQADESVCTRFVVL